MRNLVRLLKFGVVGMVGTVVQLTLLALFNRLYPNHYLLASAIATEVTVLHNFIWHWHYTWRDRRDPISPFNQLLRFQISNGLISLLGNVVLMKLLVSGLHMPLLLSNLTAVFLCSIANFGLSHNWAFACGPVVVTEKDSPSPQSCAASTTLRL